MIGKLKKLAFGVLIFSMLLEFWQPADSVSAAPTTYYVSVTGNDNNSGTSAGSPFRTIQRAANVMLPGDTAIIASGTYRETVTPTNSGSSGLPITFQAAPGATVVVSGADPVSGWTQHSGSIYRTNLAWNLGAQNQVFVKNGSNVTTTWEARWPNIDDYTLEEISSNMAYTDINGSSTTIVDSDITQPSGFWNGGQIWLRAQHGYLALSTDVVSHTGTTVSFSSSNPDYLLPNPDQSGDSYYLSGVLGALDDEREWYISPSNTLYLWAPGGGTPANVEVKRRYTAFNLNNKSHIKLQNIQVFAANIQMNNSNNNVLDGVTAQFLYHSDDAEGFYPNHQNDSGILIVGDNNEIKNSTIAYSTGTLIKIDGDNNRIVNNNIHNGNYMGLYTSLITLAGGSQNLISHNTLRDSGRANIYWIRGSANIQYNDIYNGMWLSRDGGMLYTYGADLGNSEIHHNKIHDNKANSNNSVWSSSSGFNLYLDNFTENAVVHHNVIWNGDTGIAFNTPGNFKLVYNNTVIANDDPTSRAHRSFDYWGEDFNDELYGTRVFNNIFLNQAEATSDTAVGNNIISGTGLNFVNAAARDYRIQSGSAAIDAGIAVSGITDGYSGAAPDIGAYEGTTNWTAGHNFSSPPNPTFVPVNTTYMNRLKNSAFELGTDSWAGATTAMTVGVEEYGPVSVRGRNQKLRLGGGTDSLTQTVTGLTPNTQYKLVGWIHNQSGETAAIGVRNYGGAEVSASTSQTNYINRSEVTFTTGASDTSAQVFVSKTSSGGGYSFADDLGLLQVAPEPQQPPGKLTGTVFGTAGSWNEPADSYPVVYDNNPFSPFDSTTHSGAYAGIDLGAGNAKTITKIRFHPRMTWEDRMVGGKFQGSNTSRTSGYTDLYTITAQPAPGWNEVTISNPNSYRYLRYVGGPFSYSNVSEVEFYTAATDTQAPTAPTGLTSPSKTDSSVTLSWTASTDNVGITGYEIYNGTNLAGTTTGATSFTVTGLTASTAYTFTVKAKDAANNLSAASNAVNVTTDAPPSVWSSQDIGNVGPAGSYSQSGGTFTVVGSGADIWGTADAFRYVYQPMNGDGEIVARVASIQNTDGNAKAGVMIRETLSTDAKHVLANHTPTNGAQFIYRTETAGASWYALGANVTAPYWVRLVRSGDTFTGYASPDGANWTQIDSQTIAMSANVYVGLAVVSKVSGTLNTSTFDNVTVTP